MTRPGQAAAGQGGLSGETYTLACTSVSASLAALIQQNLAAVGIQVEIETVDSATMFMLA